MTHFGLGIVCWVFPWQNRRGHYFCFSKSQGCHWQDWYILHNIKTDNQSDKITQAYFFMPIFSLSKTEKLTLHMLTDLSLLFPEHLEILISVQKVKRSSKTWKIYKILCELQKSRLLWTPQRHLAENRVLVNVCHL